MSNELEIKKNKIETMDFYELQAMINQGIAIQNQQLQKKMTELEDRQEKLDEQIKITEEENALVRELEIKRHRVEEHMFGFISLSDLGQCFQVSIGSKTMGKLLRIIGLAKTKQSKTEPFRSAIVNEFAKSVMYGDHPTYQWNPTKCIKKIDNWLDEKGYIDKFYAIEDEKELMEFIKELEEKWC